MKQLMRMAMVLCFCVAWGLGGQAEAAPQLVLGELTVAPGETGVLKISLANGDENYAGINARFFLPDGVGVTAVSEGALVTGKNFTLGFHEFTENGKNGVAIIAYSGLGGISDAGGVIMNVSLSVAAGATDGAFTLGFADDTNALLNAKSAFSNADGSQSVSHATTAGKFIIKDIAGITDTDDDGIDDDWEIFYFGDLKTAGENTDTDGDGCCDLFEYEHEGELDEDGNEYDPNVKNEPPAVILDIKVNGEDGPVYINQSDTISISVGLTTNGRKVYSDWWVLVDLFTLDDIDFILQSLDLASCVNEPVNGADWLVCEINALKLPSDLTPLITYELFDFPLTDLAGIKNLSKGIHYLIFAVDTAGNGVLNEKPQLYLDFVIVNVE